MRKASLKQHRIHQGRWQLFPVLTVNRRPDPRIVLVNGESIKSSSPGGGKFYLDYRDDTGRRVRRPCGAAPREALDAWQLQVGILNGKAEKSETDLDAPEIRKTIHSAIEQFLNEVKATKAESTYDAYADDAVWFKAKLGKHYVDQVGRPDILRVLGAGREEELAQRTINRRVLVGLMALRNADATIQLKKGDWPKAPEQDVEVYNPGEIKDFFKACTDDERILFQVYLCSGFRNREVATLTRESIYPHTSRLGVKARLQYGFKPKNYECREVRIPEPLMKELVLHIKEVKGNLVFPTKPHPKRPNYGGDKPDAHHLELCKEIAYRAGLNCGHCASASGKKRCAKGPYCEHWFLHKWRHTFATNMLRSGLDIKTLQTLLGHKNLSTTEKYLKALAIDEISDKIEMSTLAAYL